MTNNDNRGFFVDTKCPDCVHKNVCSKSAHFCLKVKTIVESVNKENFADENYKCVISCNDFMGSKGVVR